MLDRVLEATDDRDVTVAYTATVIPFDGAFLRSRETDTVVVVEPMLEGTSVPAVAALGDRPRRVLGVGVQRVELRRYGTPAEHDAAHGLDVEGLRRRLDAFQAR